MTAVVVDIEHLTNGPAAQSTGRVTATLYGPIADGGTLTTELPVSERYEGAPLTLLLAEVPAGNGYQFRLDVDGLTYERLVRPTGAGPVSLFSLPDLDPVTMQPLPDATPAWLPVIDALADQVATKASQSDLISEGALRAAGDVAINGVLNGRLSDGSITAKIATVVETLMATATTFRNAIDSRVESLIETAGSVRTAVDARVRAIGDAVYATVSQGAKADTAVQPRADGLIPRTALDARKKLIPYFAALAKVDTSPVDILFLGDSLTEGQNSVSRTKTMVTYVRDLLRARRQPAGIAGGFGYKTYCPRTFPDFAADTSIVTTGSPVAGSVSGLGRLTLQLTAGQKVTETVSNTTRLDICVSVTSTATNFTVVLDPAGANTVVWTGTKAVGAHTISVTIPNLSAHVVETTCVSGGTLYADGSMNYRGDEAAGIRVWNGGKAGGKVTDLTVDGANVPPRWAQAMTRTAADLVVIGHLTNDCQTRTAAQYKQDVLDLIALVRSFLPAVPILLAPPQERNAAGTPSLEPWASYLVALQQIAAADSLTAFFDLGERIPTLIYSSADYGLMANVTHFNEKGYQAWGSYLTPSLDFA